MKPLSGPSEAHCTKNGTFKQLYKPIVVDSQQRAAGPQFIPQDPLHIIHTTSSEMYQLRPFRDFTSLANWKISVQEVD